MAIGELKIRERGFTLIELMVVVAIIGIITAVLFVSFDEGRKQSRDKVRMAELKELQLAIELYKAQNGVYPAQGCGVTGATWTGPGPQPGWGTTCTDYISGLVPDYIPALPTDPNEEQTNGYGYIYITDATKSAYKVMVHGSVETNLITSYADDFARCPKDCSQPQYCGSGAPQQNTYAVYSSGLECQ